MKAWQIEEILTKAIPESGGWPSPGEMYGANDAFDPNAEVEKILYCVTPTADVVRHFCEHEYDLLISHHPFHFPVPGFNFHTALDCCEGGLNDMWAEALGIKDAKHFDKNLGWTGKIEPISFQDLVKKVEAFTGGKIQGQCSSKIETISSVVVCSGLGGLVAGLAADTNADCYITGENTMPFEQTGLKAIIETGHTLSERIGVKLFQKLIPGVQVDVAPLEIDRFCQEIYVPRKTRKQTGY